MQVTPSIKIKSLRAQLHKAVQANVFLVHLLGLHSRPHINLNYTEKISPVHNHWLPSNRTGGSLQIG